ncbi:hypothetical protein GGI07_000344 [Coemansia sp. Benny D115]|nr:hypothetical protein GGI07_000344 [Coemansia sp. Benny D115]
MVTLGYIEPVDEDFATETFPSKVGGKPRWLDPTRPLDAAQVSCEECKKPMVLLMQLYAPEDEPPSAFHRTLYLFVCRNGGCHRTSPKRCMRVFRAQMGEINDVYEEVLASGIVEEGEEGEDDVEWVVRQGVAAKAACVVCGLAGNSTCSSCKGRRYCSRAHQLADWDAGHRTQCGKAAADNAVHRRKLQRMLFPEHVIVSEAEPAEAATEDALAAEDSDDDAEDREGIEASDMALVPAGQGEAVEDSQVDVDRAFLMFQQRVQACPDQVLRYAREPGCDEVAPPLYVSDEGCPEAGVDVPACEACGLAREFEMQVMPQMLNFLGIDAAEPSSIDWGTLLVYSCPHSCTSDAAYVREVVCRQNFSSQGIGEKYVRAMHGDDSGIVRQIDALQI